MTMNATDAKCVLLTRQLGRRRNLLFLVGLFVILGAMWRIYRNIIPSGTAFYPYWSLLDPIVEGPRLVLSNKRRVIQVQFNDAGGAQSGNHWTWLIVDEWLTGKHVIAEGYSSPSVRRGEVPFPYRWLGGRKLSVEFVAKRSGDDVRHVDVRLP